MRRFFVILFAVLMPLQSALAAVAAVSALPRIDCDPFRMVQRHDVAPTMTATAADCACEAAGASTHGALGHHACPHLSMAVIPIAGPTMPAIASRSTAPAFEPAPFDSIVLAVPSPPPTFLT